MKKTILFLMLLASMPCMAAVHTSPVYLDLVSTQKVETMRLKNSGDQPIRMQTGALLWTQVNGENREVPTQDIKITPSMFVIPAGGEQRVRVIRIAPEQAQETQYRVVMQELPSPNYQASACNPVVEDLQKQATYIPSTSCVQAQSAVNIALTYKYPLFYRPQGAAPQLKVERLPGSVKITNTGNATARLAGLVDRSGTTAYVFPGSTMVFPVPDQKPLKVVINGQPTTL